MEKCKSDPNADKGEGGKKSENFVDFISGSPLLDVDCLLIFIFRYL